MKEISESAVPLDSTPTQAQPPPLPDFSELVGRLLLHTEELRSKIRAAVATTTAAVRTSKNANHNRNINKNPSIHAMTVIEWQHEMEDCVFPLLETLGRRTADVVGGEDGTTARMDSIEGAMFQSCQIKTWQLAQFALQTITRHYHEDQIENDDQDDDDDDDDDNTDGNGMDGSHRYYSHMTPEEREGLRQQAQAAVARWVEWNLILATTAHPRGSSLPSSSTKTNKINNNNNNQNDDDKDEDVLQETIQCYVQYQRFVLRQRVKPFIAKLVEYRRSITTMSNNTNDSLLARAQIHHDDDDDDDDDENDNKQGVTIYEQHYAPVLTHVLGQAAALIHPLLMWQSSLPEQEGATTKQQQLPIIVECIRQLCQETIQVLDEQTQVLVETVSGWFWSDKTVIEEYLLQSANFDSESDGSSNRVMNAAELGALDGLVEEMGFSCHVQVRYLALVQSSAKNHHDGDDTDAAKTATANRTVTTLGHKMEQDILPMWTLKYASLERYLAVKQWQAALAVCQPVQIVLGMPIQVPSVVEDAQFLSTRALERSATTRSAQAMGTVAHAVSHDIWSTDSNMSGSVYEALVNKLGCWSAPNKEPEPDDGHQDSSKQKLDFAAALMGAMDEDAVQAAAKGGSLNKPPSAPSSSGFLGLSLGDDDAVLQMEVDTAFCVMNGAHAAASACRALVEYLDSLLTSDDAYRGGSGSGSTKMVGLAREELFLYAGEYEKFLKEQIHLSITKFAGGLRAPRSRLSLDRVYDFFVNENYAIDMKQMKSLENDDRLATELDDGFRSSMFIKQLSYKGESNVLHMIGEELVEILTQIVSDALYTTDRKVTDWGALLFWKEIRRLQELVTSVLTSEHADQPPVYAWARLSQIATVLQLESPSEWQLYRSSTSVLTNEELEQTMALRSDFSIEAIRTVLSSTQKK